MPANDLLPTDAFNHLFEIAMAQVKAHLSSGQMTAYVPVAYLILLEPEISATKAIIAVFPDFDVRERYHYLDNFGEQCANEGHLVLAFLFVSEAWRVTRTQLQDDDPPPRDDPKRIETITAIGTTVDGRHALSYLDISRGRKQVMIAGQLTHQPYSDDDPQEAQSDLCDAFWIGYRRALVKKVKLPSDDKKNWSTLHKKAPGMQPEARHRKYN